MKGTFSFCDNFSIQSLLGKVQYFFYSASFGVITIVEEATT